MEEDVSFGQALEYQLILKGMSQKELARRMDLSESTVSKWINGLALPSLENLRRIEEVLDVSLRHAYSVSRQNASLRKGKTKAQRNSEKQYKKVMKVLFGKEPLPAL